MRWSTLLCLPLALSCGEPPEPETAGTETCKAPPMIGWTNGASPSSTPPRAPVSHIGAALHVSNKLFEQTLASSVPQIVAEGRNVSAGAAGRTTFQIKRGEPRIKTTDAGVSISVKLDGEIHLCKPFGGVCIAYGSCRPEWTAEVFARSPWRLSEEPDVTLNVEISKGCVLSPVKVDVTSELEKVTNTEVAKIRKQLDKEVRRFHRTLRKQLEQSTSVELSRGECLTFVPHELAFAIDDEDGGYTLDVEATGTPVWGCGTATPIDDRARVVTRQRLSPDTEFHLTSDIPLSALSTEWQARVPNQQLRVTQNERDLLVEVAGWQGCASGWVLYRPTYNGTLALEVLDTSDAALPSLLGLPQVVAQTSTSHAARAQRLVQSIAQPITVKSELLSRPLQLQPTPNLKATDRVRIDPGAVVLETTFEGTTSAKLTELR